MLWTGTITAPADGESALRIAVAAQNTTWYAEVPVVWMVNPD
jgi:hypothetical protein